MQEVRGDIFELMRKGDYDAFCITTNGQTKSDGKAVMGAGIAKTCRDLFDGIDLHLGQSLMSNGNKCVLLGRYPDGHILTFPTKDFWKSPSDMNLIIQSCHELNKLIEENGYQKVLLPRPGCGYGGLEWHYVKPIISKILSDKVYVVTF